MANFGHHGNCEDLNVEKDHRDISKVSRRLQDMSLVKKQASVHAEMDRVNKLPPNSSYAQHRSRVLSKLMHLLSIQRTISQDEELELLFAGLSL